MPFNGNGVWTAPAGNPVVTGTVISSSVQNNTIADIATALTDCVTRDGQSPLTVNMPAGGFQITNLGNATTRGAAVNAGQIQDGGLTTLVTVAGTDTITAGTAPLITAYVSGQTFDFIAAGANTTNAVTLNINTLGAVPVTKLGALALAPGDIQTGQVVRVRYDGAEFQVISPLSSTASASFRNKLINGNFDFWQRGVSFNITASAAYTADRWLAGSGTGGAAACVVARAPLAAGQELAGQAPTNFALNFVQTGAAGTTAPSLIQKIESVRTLQNGLVALTFYASVAAGTLAVSPQVAQFFGTGGSPSGSTFTNFPACTLTTTMQKFTVYATVPSITGKTIGTNGDDGLWLTLGFPAGATFNVVLEQVQLERGTATPFESKPPEIELALCQRYFQTVPAIAATTVALYSQSLPVQMRGVPAISSTVTPGSGAAYSMLTNANVTPNCQAFFQNVANSSAATASIKFDADL